VLAGLSGAGSSRRLFEHNVSALGNVLEYCREHQAGLLLLSSSRVYSIPALVDIPLRRFLFMGHQAGLENHGAGIWRRIRLPGMDYALRGAGGLGTVRHGGPGRFHVLGERAFAPPPDSLHRISRDRLPGARRISSARSGVPTAGSNPHRPTGWATDLYGRRRAFEYHVAGELTAWCDKRFGRHAPAIDPEPRTYDIPWMAMDNTLAARDFNWHIEIPLASILEQIAQHAHSHPDWLEVSRA
jgi:CDP-paratose 2-epimerase